MFEFLLVSEEEPTIRVEDFDSIMTPNSYSWSKEIKDNWVYYKVEDIEFSYSFEMVGIQMIFNKGANFEKAKKIAEEVVVKLSIYCNQSISLEEISGDEIISFQ